MDDLNDDWVLTHEMIHLAFPNMDDDQHWIEEGISTYVEPVARVAAGQMQADEMWRVFVRDMPKGQPQAGDKGLDNTHTWGRTYWGGALFCLFADVEIREQTHNRYGLRDALRAIMDHGGVITQDWDIKEAFKVGDKGTGTRVLENLYAQMRDKPSPMDLDGLWKKLGISLQNGRVQFDDKAPNAAIRKAITSPAR
jgi:predicted metalloprotease with PDZ domain